MFNKKFKTLLFWFIIFTAIVSSVMVVNRFIIAWTSPANDPPTGSGAIMSDAAGNVSIGSDAPAAKLHINDSRSGEYLVYIHNDNFGGHGLRIKTGDAAQNRGGLTIVRNSDDATVHSLNSDGNVYHPILGLGTRYVCSINGYLFGQGAACVASSREYKKDINPLVVAADKILDFELKSFTWKDSGEEDFGYIAEEVKEILPELFIDTKGGVSYDRDKLIFYVIELLKTQQSQINDLEEANTVLKDTVCSKIGDKELCNN